MLLPSNHGNLRPATGLLLCLAAVGSVLNPTLAATDQANDHSLVPWIAWQQNWDRLSSGRGALTWKTVAEGEQTNTVVHYDFGFDGIQKRWDRTFEKYIIGGKAVTQPSRIDLDNGVRTYDYRIGQRYVYARETGRRDDGRWNGEMLDFKYLMLPMHLSAEEFQEGLAKGRYTSTVARDTDSGEFHMMLTSGKREILLVFDPNLGYAPSREIYRDQKGNIVRRVSRRFASGKDGIWYLVGMKDTSYSAESGLAVNDFDITVHDFITNAGIPARYFTPDGLGIPPELNVRVVDRVLGDLTYSLHISEETVMQGLNDSVHQIDTALQDSNATGIEVADERPHTFAGGMHPTRTDRQVREDNAAIRRQRNAVEEREADILATPGFGIVAVTLFAVAGIAVGMCIAYLRRKHKSSRMAASR